MSTTTLVIVESPTKVPTIKGFLGKGYKVVSSKGHVRDLPKSKLGIDVEHDFEPKYINIRGKGELINALKKEAKNASKVLLATDPDREGEAISWHLAAVLGLDSEKAQRITFNELTKNTVRDAIKHPRDLDMNLVNSQQTRRILDRLVGYKISPFLWKKIKSGLSAGRVQSVATRMIVEREEEIEAFVSEEYWTISARLFKESGESFVAKFHGTPEKKLSIADGEQAEKLLAELKEASFAVGGIKKAVKRRKPLPPFTTSTLQQEANRRLGFQSQRTMMVAQELYEGVSLGERTAHGLITYMRTDSLRISEEAQAAASALIRDKFGPEYCPKTPNVYKTKAGAQDAHEAIRPSDPSLTPDSVKGKLSNDQFKLYKLIWERFMASQMKNAELDTVSVDIAAGKYLFRASGYTVKFPGFMVLYDTVRDNEDEDDKPLELPPLTVDEPLTAQEITPAQHFTQPPARFTEGSLVKMMEEKGVGRPSTFTSTITTIIARGYVRRNGKVLEPTELGRLTTKLMKDSFPEIVDYGFTAKMEDDLDKIENGQAEYLSVLRNFYTDFEKELKDADEKLEKVEYVKPVEVTDIICDKCGANMVVREGRYGKFAACPNFPKCRNTRRLSDDGDEGAEEVLADEKCPVCGADMILKKGAYGSFYACRNYPDCKTTKPYYKDTGVACPQCGKRILVKQSRSRKTFYSCEDYPNCKFSVWDVPQQMKCPKCGGLVLKKKNKEYYYCYDENCGWSETK
ncbi:MAG TPA: type I DNA topoisomerase [Firmicutes bacterium]|nr:type I DNA topoisomerase [Bacillota bacterium]